MNKTETSKQEMSAEDAFVEKVLSEMRPAALSDRFFDAVEAALEDEAGNTARFPARGGALVRFPLRRFASAAALVLCVGGLGVWSYSVYSGDPVRSASAKVEELAAPLATFAHAAKAVSATVPAVATAAVSGVAGIVGSAAQGSRLGGNYHLVNVERAMSSVRPMDVKMLESGNLSREIHYSYVDEYSWEDKESGTALVELRPNKGVVSMELQVY